MKASSIIKGNQICRLIQRTLNHVDARLVDHGVRVAFIMKKMIEEKGDYSTKEQQDLCMLALFHDIGAYKTEEIDEMISFEQEGIWKHSIYGYLFLKNLSPLHQYAEIILYHHVPAMDYQYYDTTAQPFAQLLYLADRIDIYLRNRKDTKLLSTYLLERVGTVFSEEAVTLFLKVMDEVLTCIDDIEFTQVVPHAQFSDSEIDQYLKMLVFAIDFRSEYTVTHTITTTYFSYITAKFMGVEEPQLTKVFYGAMMHDLGKIAIPVEILEFPGKLSPQAMTVMKTHVVLTAEILDHDLDKETMLMAIRHHERLDGSGYPQGLYAKDLTLPERIIEVGDVVSALLGTRSYKQSLSKEETLRIIIEQAKQGKLDVAVVNTIIDYFDQIKQEVKQECQMILDTYQGINQEYHDLLVHFMEEEASRHTRVTNK